MSDLSKEVCEACRADAPMIPEDEALHLLKQLSGWQIVEKKGVSQLLKQYKFKDFVSALNFTNRLGEIAEAAGHHPAILTEWGSVTVRWWSHEMGGLHRNDFILAARSDQLLISL